MAGYYWTCTYLAFGRYNDFSKMNRRKVKLLKLQNSIFKDRVS